MVHREAELLLQALPGEGATIFRLVIRLAHELRLAAMAEGVEGHEQRDQLE
jgi:EAL domain-containing protein (putative c-di-GMP-specific phosphodiesterase class I)